MNGRARELVQLAETLGFTFQGVTGSGHLMLVHPNGTVTLPSTPSEFRGHKNAVAQFEQVSGQKVPRANHRRSRKAVAGSGYRPDVAKREADGWHAEHDAEVAELCATREALIADCQRFAGDRGQLRKIPGHYARIQSIEGRLAAMAQPVTPFDPLTLASTAL